MAGSYHSLSVDHKLVGDHPGQEIIYTVDFFVPFVTSPPNAIYRFIVEAYDDSLNNYSGTYTEMFYVQKVADASLLGIWVDEVRMDGHIFCHGYDGGGISLLIQVDRFDAVGDFTPIGTVHYDINAWTQAACVDPEIPDPPPDPQT